MQCAASVFGRRRLDGAGAPRAKMAAMWTDLDRFRALAQDDPELALKLGALSARLRIGPSGAAIDLVIDRGRIAAVGWAGEARPDLVIAAPDGFWRESLAAAPAYGVASLTAGGADFRGDLACLVAPYYGAWERLLILLRIAACGPAAGKPAPPIRRETDDAIGRYAYVRSGEDEARLYYEEAGQGAVPLLLHATAGADSRQWRHMLAYPALRERFRMIAYDLPGHGKSSAPLGTRWWEAAYRPSRETLMGWAVGLAEPLKLDRPIFLGCSVGGQLAIDLAAYHAESFRAFVSLNGWARPSPGMATFDNGPFRDPAISTEYLGGRVLGATSPVAPDAGRQETCWIYRSNGPGMYAGDNDYFMRAHDLSVDGWRIDTRKTPLFALAGEFDRTASSPEDGAAAIPAFVPGAVFRLLPGLGHFAPSDDPETFCEAITPILDEVVAACEARA
jgi:pimeloyl-ACP methyl ester carboxylesterase